MVDEVKVKSAVKIDEAVLEQAGLYQKNSFVIGTYEDMEAAAKSSNVDIRNVGVAFLQGDYKC